MTKTEQKGRMPGAIAVDIMFLDAGYMRGLNTYARGLLLALARATDTSTPIIVFSGRCPDSWFEGLPLSRVKVVRIPLSQHGRVYRLVAQQVLLPLWLMLHKVHILHSLNPPVPFLARTKLIVTVHDLLQKDLPKSVSRTRRFIRNLSLSLSLVRCSKVITISDYTASRLRQRTSSAHNKLEVIAHGIEPLSTDAESRDHDVEWLQTNLQGREFILSLGAGYDYKNAVTILRAFAASAILSKIGAFLVLPGIPTPHYSSLRRLSSDLRVNSRVLFPGRVSDSAVAWLMSHAKVYATASTYEGFGLTPLEAMSLGVPVVSSCSAALSETVGDAAVRISNPMDVSAFREALEGATCDRMLRRVLIANGLAHASKYSWTNTARRLLEVYGVTKP